MGKLAKWRPHWGIAALVVLATALRVLVMIAYQPAFWFFGDSGSYIEPNGGVFQPQLYTAFGYTFVVQLFQFTGTLATVVLAQHLVGVLLAIALYAVLIRRSAPRWLACLAAAPILFDSLQITLEHYILTETMCTALLVGGIILAALWFDRPGIWACAAGGALIGLSWVTRPSTLPVALLVGGYLVVRRVGWRQVVAFGVAYAIPVLLLLVWVGDRQSVYEGSWSARALYSRVAGFADCDRLKLSDAQRALCPQEPLGQRPGRSDWYGWNGPAAKVPREEIGVVKDFAYTVLQQQPGDYARAVARESAPFFLPGQDLGPDHRCLREKWNLPATVRDTQPITHYCHPGLAQPNFGAMYAYASEAPAATPLTNALHVYSNVVRTPPLLVTFAFLLLIASLFTLRRGVVVGRGAGLMGLIALALMISPVAVAMYDARYGLPALPFLSLMGALSCHQLLTAWKSRRRNTAAIGETATPEESATTGALL